MLVNNSKTNDNVFLEKLQKIKGQKGIIGYILRDQKSASIDLKDPTKIIEYAVLSSTAFDVSRNMSETLQMGKVDNIVVESKETKLLSMNVNTHCLCIFMKKDVNHDKLYKNLK